MQEFIANGARKVLDSYGNHERVSNKYKFKIGDGGVLMVGYHNASIFVWGRGVVGKHITSLLRLVYLIKLLQQHISTLADTGNWLRELLSKPLDYDFS